MSITGTVENDSIKLPPGIHMPNGTLVEITWLKQIDSDGESFPLDETEQRIERAAWLTQSERRLREVWDNDADDVYNELLTR